MGVALFRGSARRVTVVGTASGNMSDRRKAKTSRRLVKVLF